MLNFLYKILLSIFSFLFDYNKIAINQRESKQKSKQESKRDLITIESSEIHSRSRSRSQSRKINHLDLEYLENKYELCDYSKEFAIEV